MKVEAKDVIYFWKIIHDSWPKIPKAFHTIVFLLSIFIGILCGIFLSLSDVCNVLNTFWGCSIEAASSNFQQTSLFEKYISVLIGILAALAFLILIYTMVSLASYCIVFCCFCYRKVLLKLKPSQAKPPETHQKKTDFPLRDEQIVSCLNSLKDEIVTSINELHKIKKTHGELYGEYGESITEATNHLQTIAKGCRNSFASLLGAASKDIHFCIKIIGSDWPC